MDWTEPVHETRATVDDQLAPIGALIRRIAAQEPAVRDLPPDERRCLEECAARPTRTGQPLRAQPAFVGFVPLVFFVVPAVDGIAA